MDAQQTNTGTSLQSSLHAATRSLHTQLNKNITARLPLCLPPNATDPAVYYLGILAFSQIYVAFERGIKEALLQPPRNSTSSVSSHARTHIQILKQSHTEGLARTQRLKHDTDLLRQWLTNTYTNIDSSVLQIDLKVQREAEARTGHIVDHVRDRPYLALAYQWTMYLALFNGGRYLHRRLAAAGSKFWMENQDMSDNQDINVLTFWHFDAATESDPEADQLKLRLKANLDEASILLTEEEREEVVAEAKRIFELCLDLIGYLDGIMAEYEVKNQHLNLSTPASPPGTPAQCRPAGSWRIWDAVQNQGARFVDGWLGTFWNTPMPQEVKE